jgi:hypothetical protein
VFQVRTINSETTRRTMPSSYGIVPLTAAGVRPELASLGGVQAINDVAESSRLKLRLG